MAACSTVRTVADTSGAAEQVSTAGLRTGDVLRVGMRSGEVVRAAFRQGGRRLDRRSGRRSKGADAATAGSGAAHRAGRGRRRAQRAPCGGGSALRCLVGFHHEGCGRLPFLMRRLGLSPFASPALPAPTRDAGGRPSASEMNFPASTSRSRSIPVSMPSPRSRYTTSSVATLPVAPFAYGTAAQAGHAGVEGRDAHLQAGVDVRQRLAVGVVEMAAHLVERVVLQRALHRRLHPLRRADADRVGHAAVVDADRLHQPDHALDLVGRHLALVRAAERARDRARAP